MHNILLVEDDEVIRQQVKKILEQWGYEVVLVEDFMEVLSIFVKEEPHLVLMDIGLPLFKTQKGYQTSLATILFSVFDVLIKRANFCGAARSLAWFGEKLR